MRRKTVAAASLFLAVSFLLAGSAAVAQEQPAMVRVITQRVQLGQQQKFESLIPKLWDAFKKNGATLPVLTSAGVSEPGAYTFVIPFDSFAQLDAEEKAAGKAFSSAPELTGELFGVTLSVDDEIWLGRPDLSYAASSPRLAMEEQGFTQVVLLFAVPAQAPALEAALKELVALRKKHGIADSVDVAQMLIGADGPAYAVITTGKDQVDFYTQSAKNTAKMGAEWQAMLDKAGPMLRRVEFVTSSSRPALNYTP
jgi:hypothetical protein